MYQSIADRSGASVDNSQQYALNELLAEWHRWASGWSGVAEHGSCAMFSNVKSSKQWDSADDVIGSDLHNGQMKTIDFHVNELEPLYRTALQIQARNMVTGRSVWTSARLPQDLVERAIILQNARNDLQNRLTQAGIL